MAKLDFQLLKKHLSQWNTVFAANIVFFNKMNEYS